MSPWRKLLHAFDMLDHRERPQFSKLTIVFLAGAAVTQGHWSQVLAIALLAAAFGRSTFTQFLSRSTFASTESKVTTRTETEVVAARDPEGHENTP